MIGQETSANNRKTQIVILGGGFAGVETARYLDRTAAKLSDYPQGATTSSFRTRRLRKPVCSGSL